MAFPDYKIKKGFFSKKETCVPDGWKDRGEVNKAEWVQNGVKYEGKVNCKECSVALHVGTQKLNAFVYCPKCFKKFSY